MRRRARAAVAVAALACAAPAPVVIESYPGDRPDDAARVIAPLRDELERLGLTARPAAVLERLGDRLPLPASSDPELSASALAEQIDLGFRAVLRGEFALAVPQLERALAAARANPWLVIGDARARGWLTRALVGLAFAHSRLGDPAAASARLAEQIRGYPDLTVAREQYGPEAERLYEATRRELDAEPRGALAIAVTDPTAQIYVDELERGRGAFDGELAPGAHRVVVAAGGVARRYTVTVVPRRQTRLAIRWELDARITAIPAWVGAEWRGTDRTAELAERLDAAELVAIGIEHRGARRVLVGRVFTHGVHGVHGARGRGAPVRTAAVEADGPAAERDAAHGRVAALAAYLATGRGGPELAAPAPRRARWPRWVAGGLASAALGTGGYLLHLDGRGACAAEEPVQCRELHRTAGLGWSLVGAAALAVAVAWRF